MQQPVGGSGWISSRPSRQAMLSRADVVAALAPRVPAGLRTGLPPRGRGSSKHHCGRLAAATSPGKVTWELQCYDVDGGTATRAGGTTSGAHKALDLEFDRTLIHLTRAELVEKERSQQEQQAPAGKMWASGLCEAAAAVLNRLVQVERKAAQAPAAMFAAVAGAVAKLLRPQGSASTAEQQQQLDNEDESANLVPALGSQGAEHISSVAVQARSMHAAVEAADAAEEGTVDLVFAYQHQQQAYAAASAEHALQYRADAVAVDGSSSNSGMLHVAAKGVVPSGTAAALARLPATPALPAGMAGHSSAALSFSFQMALPVPASLLPAMVAAAPWAASVHAQRTFNKALANLVMLICMTFMAACRETKPRLTAAAAAPDAGMLYIMDAGGARPLGTAGMTKAQMLAQLEQIDGKLTAMQQRLNSLQKRMHA